MIDIEREKRALLLVQAAVVLAEEADSLHGQPLFYDREGYSVDVVGVLRNTAEGLRKGIVEEGGTP